MPLTSPKITPSARAMLGRMTWSFPNMCHFCAMIQHLRKCFNAFYSRSYKELLLHANTRVQLLQALFQQHQPRFRGGAWQGHAHHTVGLKTEARRGGL